MYRRYYNRYDGYHNLQPEVDNSNKENNNTNQPNPNYTYNMDGRYRIRSYEKPEVIVPEKASEEKNSEEGNPKIGSTDGTAALKPNAPSKLEHSIKRLFGKFDLDDIIILGIIIILLLEECEDFLLIGILVYLFISGWEN